MLETYTICQILFFFFPDRRQYVKFNDQWLCSCGFIYRFIQCSFWEFWGVEMREQFFLVAWENTLFKRVLLMGTYIDIYNVQDQIHFLVDWNQQILSLEGQVIFGWKEKECFMHCILKNQIMEVGQSSITTSTLKRKHTNLKNKDINHCFCLP